ncbi:probable serine/threonine-protein kinase PBL7 [Tanacetum coccineum]
MAYSSTPDAFDEYLQMSEHTARDALFFFNMCIMELYMPKYLRNPTSEDVVKIQQKHNNVHGFPGMLRSIDCMHWEWKNCRVSWQGQYGRGDKKYPTIMLEAIASQDLWIWHAFYGMAGANNDINVLDNSLLFDDLLDDLSPVVPYVVNGVEYRNGYYLADGIYPYSADVAGGDAAVELTRRYRHAAAAFGDLIFIYDGLRGGVYDMIEDVIRLSLFNTVQ